MQYLDTCTVHTGNGLVWNPFSRPMKELAARSRADAASRLLKCKVRTSRAHLAFLVRRKTLHSGPRGGFLHFCEHHAAASPHAVSLRQGLQLFRSPDSGRGLQRGSVWHIDPVTVQQQASPAERAGTISAPTFMRASSMVGTAVEPVRWWVDIEIHVLRLRLRSDLSRTSLRCDGHRLCTRWRAVASPGPRPGGTSRVRPPYSFTTETPCMYSSTCTSL